MVAKKIITSLFCTTLIIGIYLFFASEKQANLILSESKKLSNQPTVQAQEKKEIKKTYDMYSNTLYDLPLISIYEISKLPQSVKKIIDEFLEASQGFYMLKKVDDKILILLQNPVLESNTYARHNLQYLELYLDGRKEFHNAGYNGLEGEVFENFDQGKDTWIFDKNSKYNLPLKHVARDDRGKVKFTEFWNYDENEPIKYLMKDSKGKTLSIMKETLESESNLRKEHLFYDNDGNITISLTINYEGANISRFTYFNSHDMVDSVSIISEYVDGHKIKEMIYNEKYELINTINSTYRDSERIELQILDSENNEVTKLSS